MRSTRRPWVNREDADLVRYVRSVTIAGIGAAVVYVGILWDLRFSPFRTALQSGTYSDFYDAQARALLDGKLHIPEGILGIEAFVHDGHEYMYFPPGPALARIPLFLFTSRFDGRLTALSMLLGWAATIVLVAMLGWRIRRVLRGRAPLPTWEAATYGLVVATVGAGSVLVYLASQPWVYHEAYAWAVAAAFACAFTLLGVIERTSPGRILAFSLALLAAVLTRATTGWAFAAAAGATAIWFLMGRHGFRALRFGRLLLVASVLPLLVGVAINMAKFDHPLLFDLKEQVWTTVNEHRQEALEENGGGLVSPKHVPSTLTAYFRPDGIRFVPVPPFVTFPEQPAKAVGSGFLDQTYRTGSALVFMPLLCGLGLWGLVIAFRRKGPDRAPWLRLPLLGAGAICGPILVYGYISYRYVAELLPVITVAALVGAVDFGHLFSLRSDTARRWLVVGVAGLAGFGVLANSAVAWTTERYSNPGPDLDRYLDVQERVSRLLPGDPLLDMTEQRDHLPLDAEGEHLLIVGDCDGLYVGQAEDYWPWVTVEVRPVAFEILLGPLPAALTRGPDVDHEAVELLRAEDRPTELRFERRSDGAFRFVYDSPRYVDATRWTGTTIDNVQILLEPDEERDVYHLHVDGVRTIDVPLTDFDDQWFRFQNLLLPSIERGEERAAGVRVVQLETEAPPRCRRLLDRITG